MGLRTNSMGNTAKELEKDIQRDICNWLQQEGYFFWRSSNIPSMGRVGERGEMRFRSLPKFTPRGLPDLMIIKNGKFIGIEVKRPGAKLRPAQAEFGLQLVYAGADYEVVHSLLELQTLPCLRGFKNPIMPSELIKARVSEKGL